MDGTSGKLGHGFTAAGGLKKMDIGPRDRPRPMCVSNKLDPEYKPEPIDLLKEVSRLFCLMRCLA